LNPLIPVWWHFFNFKILCTQFLNWVQFHVHTAHSPMLKIMWVQSFTTNENRGLSKYTVEQSIIINY
jgi:hypothetical protein